MAARAKRRGPLSPDVLWSPTHRRRWTGWAVVGEVGWRALAAAVLVGLWALAGPADGPGAVLRALGNDLSAGILLPAFAQTLAQVGLALALGLLVGGALGLLRGASGRLERILDLWLALALGLAGLGFLAMADGWFGPGSLVLVGAVAAVSIPVISGSIRQGVVQIDPALSEMARLYRIPRRQVLTPQLLPSWLRALRVGLVIIWQAAIVGEFLGLGTGIGGQVRIALGQSDLTQILAWVLPYALLLVSLDYAVLRPLEGRVAHHA